MAGALRGFLHRFVFPLLEGGSVRIGAPLTERQIGRLHKDAQALADPRLLDLRNRRAELLVYDGLVGLPETEELWLWLGLYNVLALDHPDLSRVWASERTWMAIDQETRRLLTLPPVSDTQEALARHVTVGAFTQLLRDDFYLPSEEGEQVFMGQLPNRGRLTGIGSGQPGMATQTVRWVQTPANPAAIRCFELALWSSPLTCMLYPDIAPEQWSPLTFARMLQEPAFLRAVVYHWERAPDWLALGAAMLERLPGFRDPEKEEQQPAANQELSPIAALGGDIAQQDPLAFERVICLLIHLHLLKVMDFDVRIGLGRSASDRSIQQFLALPLVLDLLTPRWGTPILSREQPRLFRRWKEYLSHLQSLLAVDVVHATRQAIATQSPQESFA